MISKRIFDITAALLILILTAPILLISILFIMLDSRGSVIYKQDRAGHHGKSFKIIKLRTMVKSADKLGPGLTQKNDMRITRVGRFLRRFSIDEIPQLINVLKGDMSIVGPRPEIISIADNYTADQKKIFDYKPGLTGISQINGRAELPIDEKIRMEIEYYKNADFISNFIIILKTPLVVISNKGNVM
jgi:lipopolysaccharide/colanic/teichoic acid biosynthesis glycosyltransferase